MTILLRVRHLLTRDNLELLAMLAGLAIVVYGTIQLLQQRSELIEARHVTVRQGAALSQQQHEILLEQTQRVQDLRVGCRRTSRTTAADVNLNWLDYLTEADLVPPVVRSSAGGELRQILEVRANADRAAALTKAQRVDVADAHLIRYGRPRQQVLHDGFSCTKAYPLREQ